MVEVNGHLPKGWRPIGGPNVFKSGSEGKNYILQVVK